MNLLDLFLAILIVWFAVSGIARGLVRQLFSLGGLVLGHLAGARYYAYAQEQFGLSFQYAEVVGYVVVFLAAYLVVRLIGGFIEGRIRKSKLSGMDRLAGMAGGLVKGALFSILIVFLLVILLPRDARLLRDSKAAPTAITAGHRLAAVFPDRFAEAYREKVRAAMPHRATESRPDSATGGKRHPAK